jgi:hypothetical protein
MKKRGLRAIGAVAAVGAAASVSMLTTAGGSSHREAPLITEDPVADATDLYAFQSPQREGMITLIGNWIPFEEPASGPNFHKFGDDVLYEFNIDNDGDAVEDVSYEFRFTTAIKNPNTFLYNTGPVTGIGDEDLNVLQRYTVTRVEDGVRTVIGRAFPVAPANIGPRSTPDYPTTARGAIRNLFDGGGRVFAGPREDPFFVDLGSFFDLLGLRPLNGAHAIPLPTEDGIDHLAGYNTHSIAIEVPIDDVTNGEEPVIGIWQDTYRRQSRVFTDGGATLNHSGDWVQVSRLGMPLVNEVIAPLGAKDLFNSSDPADDAQFLDAVKDPEPGRLVPKLYPVFDCFPEAPRDDLVAVYLTGIPGLNQPADVVPAEMLRLNTTKPPGFPNGRRPQDDVVDVTLQAVAGAALPSQECAGKAPNNALTDGVGSNEMGFTTPFPHLQTPFQGYESDRNARR